MILRVLTAIVDDMALITSANLTDDAFSRNFEIGVMLSSGELRRPLREHLSWLIRSGQIVELH